MIKIFKILFLSRFEDKKIPTNAVYHKRYVVGIKKPKKA